MITFTVRLENLSTKVLTLTDTPPLNLVITPGRVVTDPTDVQAWADDPQYPLIDSVLQPQEIRRYTWVWRADPRYASTDLLGEDGFLLRIKNSITLPSGSPSGFATQVGVGVRSVGTPTESGRTLCRNLAP